MTHQTAPIPEPKPTTYTPAQRQQIAEAFRKAKAILWDGCGEPKDPAHICLALEAYKGSYNARVVIADRIWPFPTYSIWCWLKCGLDISDTTNLQTLRHQWLDALIKEFSE